MQFCAFKIGSTIDEFTFVFPDALLKFAFVGILSIYLIEDYVLNLPVTICEI